MEGGIHHLGAAAAAHRSGAPATHATRALPHLARQNKRKQVQRVPQREHGAPPWPAVDVEQPAPSLARNSRTIAICSPTPCDWNRATVKAFARATRCTSSSSPSTLRASRFASTSRERLQPARLRDVLLDHLPLRAGVLGEEPTIRHLICARDATNEIRICDQIPKQLHLASRLRLRWRDSRLGRAGDAGQQSSREKKLACAHRV